MIPRTRLQAQPLATQPEHPHSPSARPTHPLPPLRLPPLLAPRVGARPSATRAPAGRAAGLVRGCLMGVTIPRPVRPRPEALSPANSPHRTGGRAPAPGPRRLRCQRATGPSGRPRGRPAAALRRLGAGEPRPGLAALIAGVPGHLLSAGLGRRALVGAGSVLGAGGRLNAEGHLPLPHLARPHCSTPRSGKLAQCGRRATPTCCPSCCWRSWGTPGRPSCGVRMGRSR